MQKLGHVKGRVTIRGAGGIGRRHDAVVAVKAPAIERRRVVVCCILAVAHVPPNDAVELGLHCPADAVGQKQTIDKAGGLLAGVGVNGIVFRADQFNSRGRGPEIVVELLTEVGGVRGPTARGLQQTPVALRARCLRVAVMNDEVWGDAEAPEHGQHHRRPAVVRLAGAQIRGGMVGVICVAVFARDSHGADLDRRVNGLHLVVVIPKATRVCVRVMRARVVVGFPDAVILVSHLPVFEAVALGDVGVADPVGCLRRCA